MRALSGETEGSEQNPETSETGEDQPAFQPEHGSFEVGTEGREIGARGEILFGLGDFRDNGASGFRRDPGCGDGVKRVGHARTVHAFAYDDIEAVSGTARIVNSPDFTPRLF